MYDKRVHSKICLGDANFEGTDGGISVVFNNCGDRVGDAAITNRSFDEAIFETIFLIRRFRRTWHTFVNPTTRFYLREKKLDNLLKFYIVTTYDYF